MGNLINLPNISASSFDNEPKKEVQVTTKTGFDTKNYLNVRLDKGETEKDIIFRLLPMDLETGNAFVFVHTHNVQVPKEMVKSDAKPFKTYICLSKNENIDHEKFGHKCPFCDLNKSLYNESLKTTDPEEKVRLQKMSCSYLTKTSCLCRGIQRGKENEGVKFWMFNLRDDKTDPYNQIKNLANLRSKSAAAKGKTENILDIYEGRDLFIHITADSKTPPIITDDGDKSPLSENEEQMKAWIYDEKKWNDVFTVKPYEFLRLVSEMRVPFFDKDANTWVEKVQKSDEYKAKVEESNGQIEEAKAEVRKMANEVSVPKTNFASSITIDDDMPY